MKSSSTSSIILILILVLLNLYSINSTYLPECAEIINKYIGNSAPYVGIQMTMVDQSGLVTYARGRSLSCCQQYPDMIMGTMNYPAVFSNSTNCNGLNGADLVQPFHVTGVRSLFYDRGSFYFRSNGSVQVSLVEGQGQYSFNLTYCKDKILVGHTDSRSFVFHLSNVNWGSIGTETCGDAPRPPFPNPAAPSNKVSTTSTLQASWNEGSNYYSLWETTIQNTGGVIINNLVLASTMQLKDATTMWRMNTVSPGKYTPVDPSLGPNQSYKFSFIKVGHDYPIFTVAN
ncbi:hypothetical protein DFA_12040 [Cavenderia fasciculata]|uniref:Carbohydrate binding domain-containing protein n=1 Tax=Cavenderia fasciculata TaxID=261658 RepID=F4QFG9_CACFS|nr:uncharacterized protein DFA_12040 [Cavenderia fasciculata]EGG14270.1 hypothetical protein DFA_12040 [Cavenderia fasciculata]|eukprot:XP_004350979.1 hypothetical protein DFA_12040 [Cavenderia fasciculata]